MYQNEMSEDADEILFSKTTDEGLFSKVVYEDLFSNEILDYILDRELDASSMSQKRQKKPSTSMSLASEESLHAKENTKGLYIFRVQGQVYHVLNSLKTSANGLLVFSYSFMI
ncbi:hypothetical protein ACH5RR_021485 [Cinchona calisaya]|uniref:Uncharacterized protein n=1 Tax=Cinchona calisaya TaxID=153742 RepID=A0ABD2ZHF8_9GENT